MQRELGVSPPDTPSSTGHPDPLPEPLPVDGANGSSDDEALCSLSDTTNSAVRTPHANAHVPPLALHSITRDDDAFLAAEAEAEAEATVISGRSANSSPPSTIRGQAIANSPAVTRAGREVGMVRTDTALEDARPEAAPSDHSDPDPPTGPGPLGASNARSEGSEEAKEEEEEEEGAEEEYPDGDGEEEDFSFRPATQETDLDAADRLTPSAIEALEDAVADGAADDSPAARVLTGDADSDDDDGGPPRAAASLPRPMALPPMPPSPQRDPPGEVDRLRAELRTERLATDVLGQERELIDRQTARLMHAVVGHLDAAADVAPSLADVRDQCEVQFPWVLDLKAAAAHQRRQGRTNDEDCALPSSVSPEETPALLSDTAAIIAGIVAGAAAAVAVSEERASRCSTLALEASARAALTAAFSKGIMCLAAVDALVVGRSPIRSVSPTTAASPASRLVSPSGPRVSLQARSSQGATPMRHSAQLGRTPSLAPSTPPPPDTDSDSSEDALLYPLAAPEAVPIDEGSGIEPLQRTAQSTPADRTFSRTASATSLPDLDSQRQRQPLSPVVNARAPHRDPSPDSAHAAPVLATHWQPPSDRARDPAVSSLGPVPHVSVARGSGPDSAAPAAGAPTQVPGAGRLRAPESMGGLAEPSRPPRLRPRIPGATPPLESPAASSLAPTPTATPPAPSLAGSAPLSSSVPSKRVSPPRPPSPPHPPSPPLHQARLSPEQPSVARLPEPPLSIWEPPASVPRDATGAPLLGPRAGIQPAGGPIRPGSPRRQPSAAPSLSGLALGPARLVVPSVDPKQPLPLRPVPSLVAPERPTPDASPAPGTPAGLVVTPRPRAPIMSPGFVDDDDDARGTLRRLAQRSPAAPRGVAGLGSLPARVVPAAASPSSSSGSDTTTDSDTSDTTTASTTPTTSPERTPVTAAPLMRGGEPIARELALPARRPGPQRSVGGPRHGGPHGGHHPHRHTAASADSDVSLSSDDDDPPPPQPVPRSATSTPTRRGEAIGSPRTGTPTKAGSLSPPPGVIAAPSAAAPFRLAEARRVEATVQGSGRAVQQQWLDDDSDGEAPPRAAEADAKLQAALRHFPNVGDGSREARELLAEWRSLRDPGPRRDPVRDVGRPRGHHADPRDPRQSASASRRPRSPVISGTAARSAPSPTKTRTAPSRAPHPTLGRSGSPGTRSSSASSVTAPAQRRRSNSPVWR